MKAGLILKCAGVVVLCTTLVVGALRAGGAQDAIAELAAPLGTGFTYQGELTDTDGSPITDSCEFQFSLWDSDSGGSQLGSPSTPPPVQVTDGIVMVQVNAAGEFGAGAFTGQARWLEMAVRCPAGGGAYTTLTPRQPLTAVPYSSYAPLAGSAPWSGITGMPSGFADGVDNDTTYSPGAGLSLIGGQFSVNFGGSGSATTAARSDHLHDSTYAALQHGHWGANWSGVGGTGLSLSGGDIGIFASGSSVGVYGDGANYGVIGDAGDFGVAGFGHFMGVDGQSDTNTGVGVRGTAPYTGVVGIAASDGPGETRGVYGASYAPDGRGVYGVALDTSGTRVAVGVWGRSESPWDGTGVYGEAAATGTSYPTYGVQGVAASDSGYGGAFANLAGGVALTAYSNTTNDIFRVTNAGGTVFRVNGAGNVQADGGYHCGNNIDDGAGTLDENEIAPCLFDSSPADFAEMLPAADGLEPGDVLAVDLDGQLVRSTQRYQRSVVGVYSTRPSYLGNGAMWGQAGYAPLAITGVVPVKVSAENGPIRPGDLLVASSIPGHAMRAGAAPPIGTVIGKALGNQTVGTGVIQVLVILQ